MTTSNVLLVLAYKEARPNAYEIQEIIPCPSVYQEATDLEIGATSI